MLLNFKHNNMVIHNKIAYNLGTLISKKNKQMKCVIRTICTQVDFRLNKSSYNWQKMGVSIWQLGNTKVTVGMDMSTCCDVTQKLLLAEVLVTDSTETVCLFGLGCISIQCYFCTSFGQAC